MPRVAIVGLGGLFPGASSPAELFANVLARRDESREPPPGRWAIPGDEPPDDVLSRRGCFLDLRWEDGLDPLFHLAASACRQAWDSARMEGVDRSRVGVILGALALPTEGASAWARHVMRGGAPVDPRNRHATGYPAAFAAQALGLGGTAFTLDAACASSLYAVKLAVDELQAGRADAVLAGGVSRPDPLYTQMGFSRLRALSPSGRCSPFDSRADGLVVGEGGGAFVLKRLEDAERAGDKVWGVIAGIGLSNDLEGGLLAPASEGQLRAMRAAYSQAGWPPDEVPLIECHATGTPVGDAVELRSLRELRGGRAVIGSVKSTVGHMLTAAGAAALAKVLHALDAGLFPPTANHERPIAQLAGSPFRVLREAEAWQGPRRAAVSGFGFGGINAHLLVEAHPAERPRVKGPGLRSRIVVVGVGNRFGDAVLSTGQFRIPPKEAEAMLAQQTLPLLAAEDAVTRSAFPGGERCGAFLEASLDPATTDYHLRWAAGADVPPLTADRTMGALASIAASRLARAFRVGGPCFTVSGHAVGLASEALRRGEVDWAMAGATRRADDPRDGGAGG
ncbi:MAG: hypothetical protein K2W96_15400, partial [Gemmataceae bacterium]|nr:hypothetical protein [Gemmataceae bacterium]